MKDITLFINRELKPRFFWNITKIFPEFQFKKKGNKYVSNLHADGTEGTGYKEERSVVTGKKGNYGIWDNTWQKSFDIINVFMEINHITELWEAVNKLCDIIGIPYPEYTPEEKERYRKNEERRTALEASADRQKKALFSPDGKEVLDYLHSRGWTDSEIREAELGYISTGEATTINAQRSIGDFYTLSIPLREGSIMYGFKFRTLRKDIEEKDKYNYLYGTNKKENLFNLTPNQQVDGAIVVVEGELDALHAQVRGIGGMVATGGGKLTEEMLEAAIGRGIKRITLLFDKDEKGATFTQQSIETAHRRGIPVLVATFPDGEKLSDGREIHDIDEYLQAHTPQELQNLINNAVSGSKYLLEDLIQRTIKEHGGENVTDAIEAELRDKVIALANHAPNEVERDYTLTVYADEVNINGKQAFSEGALRAVANRERAAEDTLRIAKETAKAIEEAKQLLEKDKDVQGAQKTLETLLSNTKKIGGREQYGDLLRIPSREERIRKFKEKPEALKTSYQFTKGGDLALPFVIPSGALTILAAPTSHGKSTFLRNLAIDVARRYKDEENSVLYFTFEESEEDVIAQFTNTYIGKQLHATSKRYTQTDSIIDYYKTGKPNYIGGGKADISTEKFIEEELEFSTNYLDSGKIRIYYRDYDLETLIDALEFAVSQIRTKAIFIDYIQILRSHKLAKQPRAEQLKEICISLKDFSVEHKIPVVLAAQLNREATTPLRMNNTQMAESSDIEKAANTIVCLWNSNFMPNKYGAKAMTPEEEKEIKALKDDGFEIGKGGRLFAIVTKMRGSRGVGMYSIFEFKGYCGKVVENYTQMEEQQELQFEDEEPDEPQPF